MDGITRLLLSSLSGVFALVLGGIALAQAPHKRLNRLFALYNLFLAARFILPAMAVPFLDHGPALFLYRFAQACFPIYGFFLLCFTQEVAAIYNRTGPSRLRHLTLAAVVLLFPLYLSPLMIKDFAPVSGVASHFAPVIGPAYFIQNITFFVLFSIAVVTVFRQLQLTHGLMRNQLMFMALGMAIGLFAMAIYVASRVAADMAWLYFSLQVLMNFCFAYTMFKYRLFDFDLWMRRIAIFSGVYLSLAIVPVLVFFPFRERLMPTGERLWAVLCVAALVYGVLFSLAPMVISYLRVRAEKSMWMNLKTQLEFLKEASETLTAENRLSHPDIAVRVTDALKEFYWNRMKTPLAFILAAVVDAKDHMSFSIQPNADIDSTVLNNFFVSLRALPEGALPVPFSRLDVERRIDLPHGDHLHDHLDTISKYMFSNAIEFCAPSVHDGKFHGAVMVGAKEKGIFMPDELTMILTMASHTALAARKAELLTSNKELEKLDELKHELISNITHEFKSPVGVVENAVQILMDDVEQGRLDKNRISEYLMMIRNNNSRLGVFIQNLLDVAKIENGKVHLKPATVDVEKLLRDSLELFRPTLDKKRIEPVFRSPGPTKARIDPEKIKQVFCNLLSNAIKFSDKGPLTVLLEPDGSNVLVTVRDTGRGIEPDHLDSVFEKFFQVPDARDAHPEGTGLGLAIARGWVEAHHGRLWAESEGPGKGASFYVQIPLAPNADNEDWEEEL